MSRILRIWAGAFFAVWVLAAGLAAQSTSQLDFDHWERVAKQAEVSIDLGQATDENLEAQRRSLSEYRSVFDAARDLNAARIATLRDQIAALGPLPEGEDAAPEPAGVAAERASLNATLNELLAPVHRAEAAFVRADALIGQIDQMLRSRQTDQLLEVTPSPLNPGHWQPALKDLRSSINLLWRHRGEEGPRTLGILRDALPLVVALGVLGIVLIFRGRSWSSNIAGRLSQLGLRGLGIWRFLASLLRIILPFAGLVCLALAAVTSGFLGDDGNEIILTLAILGGIMLGVRWVSERVFAREDEEALILVAGPQRARARFYVYLITVAIVLMELILQVLEVGYPLEASAPVLSFPFVLISAFSLYRIGVILRGYEEPDLDETGSGEVRASTFRRIVRTLGTGGIVVALLSTVLLISGYYNAVDGILPPYIMSLVLLGLVLVLQRFSAEVYEQITGLGRDALIPVLIGMILLILVAPVLALVWGARATDLSELWSAFVRGFAIGDSRISPTDFLAFAVIFVIGYVATRLVQSALRTNVLPKTKIDAGGQNAIVSGIGYVGIFLAALAAITGAGLDLSSLAIVAGALSVGIGFGLQTIVSNFVSGIILLVERPISEGDWIEVGGQMGYVRDISVRATRIETFDKTDVIVPNADLVSGTVTNYTRGNTVGRVIVPVGVAYGTDSKRIEGILQELAEAHPMVLAHPEPAVLFTNFGADALEFEIRCFLRDVNWIMMVKSDLNHAIAARFAEEGIEVPFAQRDLWLRNPETLVQAVGSGVKKDKGSKT